jgi:hypothetical protein
LHTAVSVCANVLQASRKNMMFNGKPSQKNNRRFLIVTSIVVFIQSIRSSNSQQSDNFFVQMRLEDSSLQQIPPSLRQSVAITRDVSAEAHRLKQESPPERGVPVFFILLGALSVPVVWQSMMEMIRQYYYGGVIIDAREKPPLISNSHSVPANMVFFIDANGKARQFRSQDFSEAVLKGLLKGS